MNNKIITKETDPQSARNAAPKPRPALTQDDIGRLAGALHRIREISAYSIKSPTVEAEGRGLIEYLSSECLQHGEELLGAWVTMRREYQPLLQTVAAVAFRVGAILAESAESQTKVPEKPATSGGGLI